MSRSAFAARFCEMVGAAPIDYLSRWRMTLAKAAELAGYRSVSAFSTAFSRAIGCPPTAYSRRIAQQNPS
jgi:AraC-like DNA-binding protein